METINSIISYIQNNSTSFIIPLFIISYLFYYKKYRLYKFAQSEHGHGNPKLPRGLCPPFFPNGWYRLMASNELKPGDVRSIDCVGRNVVLFRGTDNKAYVLDAYCAHMGANLGIGGKVKHTNCVECPFHGWMFDGSTGKSILDSEHTARHTEFYDYQNGVEDPKKNESGNFLKKCGEGEAHIKKYEVREINGFIMVWFHCIEEYRNKPLFEPLIYDVDLERRGESVQYVNCHIQEMPENGADIKHFDYVHLEPVAGTVNFSKFRWGMKTKPAADPDLMEYMKHDKKYVNDFKMERLKKYLTEENKPYTNVISLDCWITFFGRWEIFFFNATGLQTGPSQVLLFLISPFFEVTFLQHVIPVNKFMQKVYHNCYTSTYLPYWVTALILRLEVQQVLNDTAIWNRKTFGAKLGYNMKIEADRFLMIWRNWYAQFYEGGKEFQEKIEKLGCPPPTPKFNKINKDCSDLEDATITFNNQPDDFRSFISSYHDAKSNENADFNEKNEKNLNERSNSYLSFDDFEYMYETSIIKFNPLSSDSSTLIYENNKFYKMPKTKKEENGGDFAFCSCLRKKKQKDEHTTALNVENKCLDNKDKSIKDDCSEDQVMKKINVNNIIKKESCILI